MHAQRLRMKRSTCKMFRDYGLRISDTHVHNMGHFHNVNQNLNALHFSVIFCTKYSTCIGKIYITELNGKNCKCMHYGRCRLNGR